MSKGMVSTDQRKDRKEKNGSNKKKIKRNFEVASDKRV
jgi:hypothetical protein